MSTIIIKPTNYKSTKALLKKARKLIAKGPWVKGSYLNTKTGEFCAVGALYAAQYGIAKNGEYHYAIDMDYTIDCIAQAEHALNIVVRKSDNTYFRGSSIVAYNDNAQTTLEDVLNIFDKAIEYLN